MVLCQKILTKKQKIIIYIASAITAVILALCAVAAILNSIKNTPLNILSSANSTLEILSNSDTIIPTTPTLEIVPEKNQDIEEIAKEVKKVEQTNENTITVQNTEVTPTDNTKRKVLLPVKYLAQNPELPTGCEITSLTTVLNYYGYNVSKTTMADDFLEKSKTFPADFWTVFLGNPRSASSFGCYAQPITDAANKYFATQGKRHKAINFSGQSFETLLKEVEEGRPVIIWSTMYSKKSKNLCKPYTTYKWNINGKVIQWIAPEHCMVLIGYDLDKSVAVMSDPQRGIFEYDLETVKSRYKAIYSQCVVIKENDTKLPPTITTPDEQ